MEDKKSYYAIIPAEVRYDKSLNANAKLLYGEITALCNERGFCWASNHYFAELYGVSETSISLWIKKLIDSGYIKSEIEYNFDRKLYIIPLKEKLKGVLRKVKGGIKKSYNPPLRKVKDNNTINITVNNTSSEQGSHTLIPEVLKEMEKIDPVNKTFYGNTTQRKACQYLIDTYRFENVIKAINFIAQNKGKIFNIPTTPLQLQNRWVAIINDQIYKKNNKTLEIV